MIQPDTPEGRKAQALMNQAADAVRLEKAMALAKQASQRGQRGERSMTTWAKVAGTRVGPLTKEDQVAFWQKFRDLCTENEIDYPFTAEEQERIVALMNKPLIAARGKARRSRSRRSVR